MGCNFRPGAMGRGEEDAISLNAYEGVSSCDPLLADPHPPLPPSIVHRWYAIPLDDYARALKRGPPLAPPPPAGSNKLLSHAVKSFSPHGLHAIAAAVDFNVLLRVMAQGIQHHHLDLTQLSQQAKSSSTRVKTSLVPLPTLLESS